MTPYIPLLLVFLGAFALYARARVWACQERRERTPENHDRS